MKSPLDGNLHSWLRHLGVVQKLIASDILSLHGDLSELQNAIIKMIRDSRKQDANWLWTEEDIHADDDIPKSGQFSLPSIDIAGFFGLKSHGDLPAFFKKNKCAIPIDWDTEHSAWYPRFNKREDAVLCIKFVNGLFDAKYLIK